MKLTKTTFFLGCIVGGMGAALIPLILSSSHADTKLLPFQGRLTDASGLPIADGAKVVEFKMYDSPTGGNVKWAGEVQKLSVNGGLVNTILGSKASLGSVDFSTPSYLQITIDADNNGQINAADPPLLPRQSVVPAVYAAVTGQMQYVVPGSGGNPATVASKGWEAVFDNGNPVTGAIKGNKINLPLTTSDGTGAITQNGTTLIHTFGSGNFFAGSEAGNFSTAGVNNTGVGTLALQNITTGSNNTALGLSALRFDSSGVENTATGTHALNSNTIGSGNTASGYQSLYSNQGGNANTAMGDYALQANGEGLYNTAVGYQSNKDNSAGSSNTALGMQALLRSSASNNTALGFQSLAFNSSGHDNIAVGNLAGNNLTTGSNNIDIGNVGVAGEGNTVRIGTQGVQIATYIAGIAQSPLAVSAQVGVDTSGRLGTMPPRSGVASPGLKVGDVVYSASSGGATYVNNPTTVAVTGQSLFIKAGGSPVMISLTSSGATSFLEVNGSAGESAVISLWRDDTVQLCSCYFTSVSATLRVPPSGISFLDIPSSADHTYTLKIQYTGSGHCVLNNVRLVAVEF